MTTDNDLISQPQSNGNVAPDDALIITDHTAAPKTNLMAPNYKKLTFRLFQIWSREMVQFPVVLMKKKTRKKIMLENSF